MQPFTDNTIDFHVQTFQKGDNRSFNYFFDLHYAPICYFAFSIIKEQAIAEEIADDAFIKLWERHKLFDNRNAIKAFLYRVVHNTAITSIRNTKTQTALQKKYFYLADKDEQSIQHEIIRAETLNQIYVALNTLPEKCRKVFTLFYIENKSYEEIADELKTSINNVRNHKMRALSLLRGQLGNSLLAAGLITLIDFLR